MNLTINQQTVANAIETNSCNYLVHGKPGVGKSVLIRWLVENGRKDYTLAAPTGLAALNINGRTLHSLFRLPISQGIIHPTFNNYPIDDRVINNIKYNIRCLIIDEISMVRCDVFDYIDRFCRFVKGKGMPFGGLQVIVVGDFFQLPPVVSNEEKIQLRDAGYASEFVFDSKVFQESFKTLFLNEVLRQSDPTFLQLLHDARTGDVTPKQVASLNKHVGKPDDLRIRLTGTNAQAEAINKWQLEKLPGSAAIYNGVKFGDWPALPCEERLELKVGAQVMVKMNGADREPGDRSSTFESRVVNGTLGVVVGFNSEKITPLNNSNAISKPVVDNVVIRLDSGDEVTIWRKKWERKIKFKEGDKWDERVVASFDQMPLSLAWAISIHKSQGQSFDKVHIDASKIFAPGQLYVALSRARSLDGLSLESEINTRKFFTNSNVMRFNEEMKPQQAAQYAAKLKKKTKRKITP